MIKKFNPFSGTFDYLNDGVPVNITVEIHESLTGAQLDAKIAAESLVIGKQYLQTDFVSKGIIEGTGRVFTGEIEPLIFTAVSSSKLGAICKSVVFPSDVIEIDLEDKICEDAVTARMGKITFRQDKNGNSTPYDFRAVKFERFIPDCAAWESGTYVNGQFAKVGNMIYKCISKSNGPSYNPSESPVNSKNWIKFLPTDKPLLKNEISATYMPGQEQPAEAIESFSYTSADFFTFSDPGGNENSEMFSGMKIGKARAGSFYSNNVFIISEPGKVFNVTLENGANGNTSIAEIHDEVFSGSTVDNIFTGSLVTNFNAPGVLIANIIDKAITTTILGPCVGNVILDVSLSTIFSECVFNNIKKLSNCQTGSDFWANSVIDLRYSALNYHFKNNFVETVAEFNSKQKVEECYIRDGVRNCVVESELFFTIIPEGTVQTTFAFNDQFGADLSQVESVLQGQYYKKLIQASNNAVFVQYIDDSGSRVTIPILKPVIESQSSALKPEGVQLSAIISDNGASTSVKFQYGTTIAYGYEIVPAASPAQGNTQTALTALLSDLLSNTTYHWRVVITNSSGTVNGLDQVVTIGDNVTSEFTDDPAVISQTENSVTIGIHCISNDYPVNVRFEWGNSTERENTALAIQNPLPISGDPVLCTAILAGLVPDTTYFVKAYALNKYGETESFDIDFFF